MAGRKAPRAPAPSTSALARLAELAGKGTPPDRMAREVDSIVDRWLADTGVEGQIEVKEQLEDIQAQLTEGVEAALEAAADMDQAEKAAITAATKSLAALVAARDAVARARLAL